VTEIRNLKSRPVKRRKHHAACAATALLLVLGLATAAQGQESIRMSMASAAAAEARQRAASSFGYYNLKLGPTAWNFGAGLEVDYNSNVNYSQTDPEGDFIFRPQINTRLLWPLSDQNSLNLALGAGYSAYVQHSTLDQLFITPGSELSFDMYVGDFWINFHDRFSITENTYQDPSVAGTGGYSQLQNALGVTPVWDLNKIVLRLGYDHLNYISLGGNQNRPDGQAEVVSWSAGYALRPKTLLGVELGGQLMRYTGANTYFSSAEQWNAGCFYETQASEYIHFTGHAGYTVYTPEGGQSGYTAENFNGMYAQLTLTHRVNQYLDYSLSGGRNVTFALYGGTVEQYSASLQAQWRILRKISLGAGFDYYHGSQLLSGGETYDQYGPRISLSRPISAKLSGGLGYQVYWRGSNQADRNYTTSVVSLNLNYRF
jgi:hypothetical protein